MSAAPAGATIARAFEWLPEARSDTRLTPNGGFTADRSAKQNRAVAGQMRRPLQRRCLRVVVP
jgi:hypothetical protein